MNTSKLKKRGITVAQLIELLQGEDPDAIVLTSSDYGDYSHTEQVHAVTGDVSEVSIKASAYSASGFAINDDGDDGDDDGDGTVFIRIA